MDKRAFILPSGTQRFPEGTAAEAELPLHLQVQFVTCGRLGYSRLVVIDEQFFTV